MIIDWNKIERYIHNRASKTEQKEVEMWIKRSEENYRFFDNAKRFYAEDFRFFENERDQVDLAWQKVAGRTINRKNIKQQVFKLVATTVAVAGAMVALYFGVYQPKSSQPFVSEFVPVVEVATDSIAEDKGAKLILADGSVVKLSQDNNLTQEVADFKIEGNRVEIMAEKKIEQKPANNQIVIPKGETYQLILPDSSTVILNAGTVLSFPTSFSDNERRVSLIGEAYFTVKKNEKQPFIVDLVDGSHVEVLGTEFNVKARRDNHTHTALVSGKVLLQSQSDRIILAPGEMCVVDKDSKHYDIVTPDLSSLLAWTRGEFIFKNMLLEEIIEELKVWYDVEIEVANEFVKRKRFHIYLDRTNSIEAVMDKLAMTEQISYTKIGKKIEIDNFNR